jgi:formylglycine-generating enzyme required for sulfatase activity
MPILIVRRWTMLMLGAWMLAAPSARTQESWPDLSKPARAVGGGEHDSAVVVGVESYFAVPGVPGAKSNAVEWYDYLTATRGVPFQNVKLLTNSDATRERILGAARGAASSAGKGGTVWFVFIGHGAPSADGKDGLLVGVDAQQEAESLQERSVRRGELLTALSASPAGSIRVVLDACFSGRGQDGATIAPGLQPLVTVAAMGALDPRIAVLTAAKGNQFAGALPGADRPAFSYLVLGGLRGWAAGADGKVTAGSLWNYTKNALAATLRGRDQTPDLLGAEGALISASSPGEKGPNLAGLAKATASAGTGRGFQVTNLASVPVAEAPKELGRAASGLDLGSVDVEALEKYDAAAHFEKGDGEAVEKARMWRELAKDAPKFADLAGKRAEQWETYAAQKAAAEAARAKRVEARDGDWEKLGRLLALKVVSEADKTDWSGLFLKAYMKSPGLEPLMAKSLAAHAAPGPTREALKKLVLKATETGKAGILWVNIPGGNFMMGSEVSNEKPIHRVSVKSFKMSKTEVTNRQYKACIAAGACTAAAAHDAKYDGDNYPVVAVDWDQAQAFAKWAGGRLPTEAEWEYAARSGGKDQKFPWGNADATCERAVSQECGDAAAIFFIAPVCSKTAGNTQQDLCDMVGNVWEWTQDWYHGTYDGAPTDGSAWENPEGADRVVRGGSYCDGAGSGRSALRCTGVDGRRTGLGLRLAR